MTTGESILTISIVGGVIYGLYLINKKKKWKLVIKIILVFILLSVLIGAATYGYDQYQKRPTVMTEFTGLQLGMQKVDVTLRKGQPSEEEEFDDGSGSTLRYKDYSSSAFVSWNNSVGVYRICSTKYSDEIFGLGKYDSYDDIVKRLGEPEETSINAEGTGLMANYNSYNVAFGVNAGEVYMSCVTATPMTFIEEYSD